MVRHAAVLFAVMVLASPVMGADRQVELLNKTEFSFMNLHLGTAEAGRWGDDVLGTDTVDPGEAATVGQSGDPAKCRSDVKAVTAEGPVLVWTDVDLCGSTRLALLWNEKTKKGRVRAE